MNTDENNDMTTASGMDESSEITTAPDTPDAPENTDDASPAELPVAAAPLPSPKTARLSYCAIAEMRPSPESRYAPMSVFSYVVMLAATGIPVLGFMIAVIVACTSKKLVRQRLALAAVIVQTILIVSVSALLAAAVFVLDVDIVGYLISFLKR